MDRALMVQEQRIAAQADVLSLGKVFVASGLFADAKSEAQAIVKIMAGRELGFPPVQSMMGVNIVMGKVDLSATLMAALVKRDGRYNYRVVTNTVNECVIEFYEHGKLAYQSRYTIKDAETAGLVGKDMWKKYPRQMLYARCLSMGANIVCPERVSGLDVSDDLSADDGIPPTQTVTGGIAGQVSRAADHVSEPPVQMDEPQFTEQPIPAQPTPQNGDVPFADFIANPAALRGFWKWAKDLGLTEDDVHVALNVDSLKDVTGTKAQVKATLESFARSVTKPADEPLFAEGEK